MTTKFTPHRYFWIIFVAVLVACGITPPAAETPTTTMPVTTKTPTPLPAFTSPPPSIVLPAFTPIPSPAPIPVSTTTEIVPLDNLRMAYVVDGNLYVQDGSNPPKQLSNNSGDISPMFSDDGETVIFYRGKIHDNNSIFSINADGSHEQELISTEWLDTLGVGTKAGHLAFIPKTHQIIFNTYLCPEYDPLSDSGCTVGLFLADTDTGTIKEIMTPSLGGYLPWYGDSPWLGNFNISPDGKLLAVAHAGQIDILNMDGKVTHQSIMKYTGDMPSELYPRMYWFSDLSGLIVALPAEVDYRGPGYSGDPTYTIWRDTFDRDVATQIPLTPPPLWMHMDSNDVLSISPNREWVVYFTNDCQLYKGNLLDGSTELLLPCGYFLPMLWSSNNIHFADRENPTGSILGSVNASLGYSPGYFVGWIDEKRFIYFLGTVYKNKEDIQIFIGEIGGETILSYESNVFVSNVAPFSYSFVFTVLKGK